MNQKPMVDPRILEDQFYAKKFYFSYTSLNKLLNAPMLFYKDYILGEKEDLSDKSLVYGKIVHCLLFNPEEFDDNFVISMENLPSDNVMQVVQSIYEIYKRNTDPESLDYKENLEDFEADILKILKEMNLYQKMSDEIKVKRVLTPEAIEYFTFLKNSSSKTIIDSATYGECADIVDKLKNHSCMNIMGMGAEGSLENVYNEVDITLNLEEEGFPFGIKGFLDNIFIDHAEKTLRINDLKTTSKTITDFPDAVNYYNYSLQAAIYVRLANEIINTKYPDYKIVFNFIVIDKYHQIYAFEVSEDTMNDWLIDLHERLKEAKHHYTSRDYSLPYNFLKSKVIL